MSDNKWFDDLAANSKAAAEAKFHGMTGDDELRRRFYRQYPPEERTILQGLIAELRGRHKGATGLDLLILADRADARLKGLTDE